METTFRTGFVTVSAARSRWMSPFLYFIALVAAATGFTEGLDSDSADELSESSRYQRNFYQLGEVGLSFAFSSCSLTIASVSLMIPEETTFAASSAAAFSTERGIAFFSQLLPTQQQVQHLPQKTCETPTERLQPLRQQATNELGLSLEAKISLITKNSSVARNRNQISPHFIGKMGFIGGCNFFSSIL